MNFDILELLNSTLGGPMIRRVSAYLGETEQGTHAAVRAIEPTLLAGLMQQVITPSGAVAVLRKVTDPKVDVGIAAKLPGIFADKGQAEAALDTGEVLAGTVLGNRMGGVASAISEVSGVMPDSAQALISMVATLLFGLLGKYTTQNDLGASGLAALLLRQRDSLQKRPFDERITSALGFGSRSEMLDALALPSRPQPAATTSVVRMKQAAPKPWLPWAIAAGIAVVGMLFFVNRTAERHDAETASTPQAAQRMKVAVAPTQVYFEAGEARIDPEDRQRIAGAAQSARTQDRSLAITGYTHRAGDEDENYELAKDRAYAVRDALVDAGVAEEKIVVDPPAMVTGSGEEEAVRRVDIDVR